MIPGDVVLVAALAVAGAVIGATLLPRWADAETRGAVRSGIRVRVVAALATAAAFGVLGARLKFDELLPAALVLAAAGVALSIVDLREQRLPNRMLLVAAPAVAVLLVVGVLWRGEPVRFLWLLAGAGAMFALYLVIALAAPSAMGMGDVKFAALLGAPLGAVGLTAWLGGLLGAFLVGGVVAVVALVAGRVGWRGSIPFGPSMAAGALLGLAL
jgi:Type II secretory pathway, prepilin signal peptidase PulO and related peptidases